MKSAIAGNMEEIIILVAGTLFKNVFINVILKDIILNVAYQLGGIFALGLFVNNTA